jgi:hypothetical protein
MVSSRDINQFHSKITKATKIGPKTEIGSADYTDYADFGLRPREDRGYLRQLSPAFDVRRKLDQGTARSLSCGPELDLLNVLKCDEAGYPILRVDHHKRRDIRIHFLRDRRQVNEVGMIDGKTAPRTGNDNKGRKSVRLDDIRNLFSRHKGDPRREFTESKHIILLLGRLKLEITEARRTQTKETEACPTFYLRKSAFICG